MVYVLHSVKWRANVSFTSSVRGDRSYSVVMRRYLTKPQTPKPLKSRPMLLLSHDLMNLNIKPLQVAEITKRVLLSDFARHNQKQSIPQVAAAVTLESTFHATTSRDACRRFVTRAEKTSARRD